MTHAASLCCSSSERRVPFLSEVAALSRLGRKVQEVSVGDFRLWEDTMLLAEYCALRIMKTVGFVLDSVLSSVTIQGRLRG